MQNLSSAKKILIAIIAHNEEQSIGSVIDELILSLNSRLDHHFNIVVFDDCSTDNTRQIALMRDISVVSNFLPTGNGMYMIPIYLKYASIHDYDYVLQVDADGQHPIESIPSLIYTAININSDITIGSRYCQNSIFYLRESSSFLDRVIGTQLITFLLYITTRVIVRDPTSGFRVYTKKVARFFAANNAWPFDSFILLRLCLKRGFSIHEYPVKMKARRYGFSEFSPFRKILYLFTVIYSFFYSFFL